MYGCDIALVREIVPYRAAARLPGSPSYVRGLINLRGSIVTVLDLAARLSADGCVTPDASIILVEHGPKLVGLAVDEVRDVQPLPADRLEAATGELARGGIVRGLGHLDDAVVIVLDVAMIVRQALV